MKNGIVLWVAVIGCVGGLLFAQPQPPPPRGPSAMEEALRLYAALTGRTILRPALLPRLPESIVAQVPADTNAAIELIEGKLAANGIEVVRGGQLFAWVLPEGWKETPLAAQLARIKPPPAREGSDSDAAAADQQLPAGTIDFQGLPLEQVLDIYSEMRSRTVLRPSALARVWIRLRTQSPLTRDEAVYALNVVLAMNGVAAIDDGDKFVQVVPAPRIAEVVAKAPRRETDAAVKQTDQLPEFRPGLTLPPTADGLVAFYAGLTSRKPASSEPLGRVPIFLKVQTPLTKAELLYAIETTLALNNLAIVAGDNDSVRVGPSGFQRSPVPSTAVSK